MMGSHSGANFWHFFEGVACHGGKPLGALDFFEGVACHGGKSLGALDFFEGAACNSGKPLGFLEGQRVMAVNP